MIDQWGIFVAICLCTCCRFFSLRLSSFFSRYLTYGCKTLLSRQPVLVRGSAAVRPLTQIVESSRATANCTSTSNGIGFGSTICPRCFPSFFMRMSNFGIEFFEKVTDEWRLSSAFKASGASLTVWFLIQAAPSVLT